jgi:hypothetical protein
MGLECPARMRGFFRFLPADDAGSPGRVLNLTFETNAND